jgi:outer membrane protein assembly factor BamA
MKRYWYESGLCIAISIIILFCSTESNAQKVAIHSISFKGNEITKASILQRELFIKKGDSILKKDIQAILESNSVQLRNLKLFSVVRATFNYTDSTAIQINFQVYEIFYWLAQPSITFADRNFNVWWYEKKRDLSRLNYGLSLEKLNMRGRNETLSTGFELGYNKFAYIKYIIPYIDKSMKHGAGFSLSYLSSKEINYETKNNKFLFYKDENQYPYNRYVATLFYFFRPKYRNIHQLQTAFYHYTINSDLYNKNNNFLGGERKISFLQCTYKYGYKKINSEIYPTKGMEINIIPSVKLFDVNQLSLYTHLDYFHPLNKKWSLAFNTRLRLTYVNHISYFNNRAMGLRNDYVRGYEYYVIDGAHFAITRANIRYAIFNTVLNKKIIKSNIKMPIQLYAKSYYDIGYVQANTNDNSFLNDKLLKSGGIGIDLSISYYVKIRIEYSINNLQQKGLFLHGTKE